MDTESKTTQDHQEIRRWVEEREGKPAVVKATHDDQRGGLLRIDFRNDENLEIISWEEFFQIFDENNLQFLYQEHTSEGEKSRFFKFTN